MKQQLPSLLVKGLTFFANFLALFFMSASALALIDVNKSFAPATVYPTQISELTVTLQNSSLFKATNVTFTDVFPDNVLVASPANIVASCDDGGAATPTITATNVGAHGELSVSGAVIPPGDGTNPGSCSITVDVVSNVKGTYINRIEVGDVTSITNGSPTTNIQATEGTLAVILQDLSGTVSYEVETSTYGYIQNGEKHRKTITLTNANPIDLTGVAFFDDLWAGAYNIKAVDDPADPTDDPVSTCGGNVTITPRPARSASYGPTSRVDLTNGVIPASGSCTVSFSIEPSRDVTLPYYSSTTWNTIPAGNVTSNEGATNSEVIRKRINASGGLRTYKYFDGSRTTTINSITGNASATLRLLFRNYNAYDVTGFDFTDVMPAPPTAPSQMTVDSILTNTCGGTITNNGTDLTLTNGTLPGGGVDLLYSNSGSCEITATVSVTGVGTYLNTIPSDSGGGHSYSATDATLTISGDAFNVTKAFNNTYFYQGDERLLTYTFTNYTDAVSGVDVTNLDLVDVFSADCSNATWCPATDFLVSGSAPVTSTCSGTVSAPVGGSKIYISDVTIPKASSCTVSFPVVSSANSYPTYTWRYDRIPLKTTPTDPDEEGITFQVNGGGATQIYTLIPESRAYVRAGMRVYKYFTPDSVGPLGVTRARIELRHYSYNRFGIDSLGFRDTLPTGHTVAADPDIVNECGGTVTAIAGSDTITLANGTIPAFASGSYRTCNVYVNVQVPALTPPNTIETATNTIPGDTHGDAPADLEVTALKTGEVTPRNQMENYYTATARVSRIATSVTLNKEFLPVTINGGGLSRVRIVLSNIDASAVNLTEATLTDDFSSSDISLYSNVNPTFTDNSGSTTGGCRGGSFSGAPGQSSITLSDAEIDAGSICYFEFNVTALKGGNHINTIAASDLITKEGVTNDNAVAATLTVGRQVNVGKGFSPAFISIDDTSELTIDFYNTNVAPNDETGATPALIDEMPAGLVVHSIDSNNCGGTANIITQNGNHAIRLDGGTFVAESVCQIKATVSGAATGHYINQIAVGELITLSGTHNPDPAQATLTIVEKPTITKAFSPTTIRQNGVSTIAFTLSNPNNATLLPGGLTGISFTDNLSNMQVATPPNIGGTCADVEYVANPGASNVSISDATIPPSGSCTIRVDVTSTTAGLHDNQTTGVLTDQTQTIGVPSNIAQLRVLEPVTLDKSFSTGTSYANAPVTLTFTLSNPNPVAVNISNPGFTDVFPTTPGAMLVAATPAITNTCGSSLRNPSDTANVTAGDSGIRIENGSVPANGSCSISIDVMAGTEGNYLNTTTDLETAGGTGAAASDTITILKQPPFPPGPGLGNSVCGLTTATDAWQDAAIDWRHNEAGGTSPEARIHRSDLIASATDESIVGLTAAIDSYELNIDYSSIPASYDAGKYLQYTFTTTDLGGRFAEIRGAMIALMHKGDPTHTTATGAYRFAMLVDDDPAFGSPQVLLNDVALNDGDTSTATVAAAPTNIANKTMQTYAHYDASGETIELQPDTTYTVRVYPFDASKPGDDNPQSYTDLVLWDDFYLKMVSCGQDRSDAPVTGTAPDGSNSNDYGEATHTIDPDYTLGGAVDADDASIAHATADGDGADDDGVSLPFPSLTQGKTTPLDISVRETPAGSAFLQGWIDFDGNGVFDAGEQIAADVQDGGIGDLLVTPGVIRLNINVPLTATTNPTFARFRWSTILGLNTTDPAPNGEVEDYQLTIQPGGFSISGRVYQDTDVDGVNDAGESGVPDLPVVLTGTTDTSDTVCISTRTVANGEYVFSGILPGNYQVYEASRETVPTPQSCHTANARDPSGFVSTTNNVSPPINVVDSHIIDVDFGDINMPRFLPDNNANILPGNVVLYAHIFRPESSGTVTFSSTNSNPLTAGWSNILYPDSNCNGKLDGTDGDSPIGTNLATTASTNICLINKVFAPSNVQNGESWNNQITASFDTGNAIAAGTTLTVNDHTIAAVNDPTIGSSRLELRKTVENLTQGSAETEQQNQAKPGDVLKYHIYYSNSGDAPLTELVINDAVPAFTTLQGGTVSCDSTPAALGCLPDASNDPELKWDFSGSLEAGDSGEVSYQIKIDQP